jgi:hypothetical protein
MGLFLMVTLGACSSLPKPGSGLVEVRGLGDGAEWVRRAAEVEGDAWRRAKRVEMRFSGEWRRIVERLQPGLVDTGFRKRSVEVYEPGLGRVRQTHVGPMGTKVVKRTGREVEVVYNGVREKDEVKRASAALVADAYCLFGFGASWLQERGRDFRVVGRRSVAGEDCVLVEAVVRPGFGESKEDWVIAWIGEETRRVHRVQLTLFGLESTAMADVDVVRSRFRAGPKGTEWAGCYVEHVQRPLLVKAHEWVLEGIEVE